MPHVCVTRAVAEPSPLVAPASQDFGSWNYSCVERTFWNDPNLLPWLTSHLVEHGQGREQHFVTRARTCLNGGEESLEGENAQ